MCSIQMIATPSRVDALDRVDELGDLGLGEPAGDLVEQQHRRLGRQRPGQLEPLALEQRQRAGGHVGAARPCRPARARDRRSSIGAAAGVPAARIAPTSTFSNTVSPSNGRGTCAVRPMPRRQRRCDGSRVTSSPSKQHRARASGAGRRRAGSAWSSCRHRSARRCRAPRPASSEKRSSSMTVRRAEALGQPPGFDEDHAIGYAIASIVPPSGRRGCRCCRR